MSFKRQRKSDNSELSKVRLMVEKPETTSLNANIDAKLHKKLKMSALVDNITLQLALENAISLYLKTRGKKE